MAGLRRAQTTTGGLDNQLDHQRGEAQLVHVLIGDAAPDDQSPLVRTRHVVPQHTNAVDPLVTHGRSVGRPAAADRDVTPSVARYAHVRAPTPWSRPA